MEQEKRDVTIVSVAVPVEKLELIDELAKERCRSRSSQIVFIINHYLEHEKEVS
jgi:metal-responsive CopG/Arc/MetJ family transcriptional regulator